MPFGLPDTVLSTELDAVNMVLQAKGLDLVDSITLADAEVASAAFLLNAVDLEFQSKGWWFNKDYSLQLPLESDGTIELPQGTLSVANSYWGDAGSKNLSERAGKLWDLDNHTFTFTSTQIVDIVLRQAFTDMPQVARNYVAILAAHRAQGLGEGSAVAGQYTSQMVLSALALVEQQQDEVRPNNQVHQNISVQGAINGFGGLARSRTT